MKRPAHNFSTIIRGADRIIIMMEDHKCTFWVDDKCYCKIEKLVTLQNTDKRRFDTRAHMHNDSAIELFYEVIRYVNEDK